MRRPKNAPSAKFTRSPGCASAIRCFKGLLTFPLFAHDEDWYAFVFVVTEFDGELINSPEGRLRWVPDDELLSLNLWEGDRVFLPWLDRPGFFSGKFSYVDGQLLSHSMIHYDPDGEPISTVSLKHPPMTIYPLSALRAVALHAQGLGSPDPAAPGLDVHLRRRAPGGLSADRHAADGAPLAPAGAVEPAGDL